MGVYEINDRCERWEISAENVTLAIESLYSECAGMALEIIKDGDTSPFLRVLIDEDGSDHSSWRIENNRAADEAWVKAWQEQG